MGAARLSAQAHARKGGITCPANALHYSCHLAPWGGWHARDPVSDCVRLSVVNLGHQLLNQTTAHARPLTGVPVLCALARAGYQSHDQSEYMHWNGNFGALLFINRVEYTPPRDLDPQELLLGPNEYFKLCKSYIFLEE